MTGIDPQPNTCCDCDISLDETRVFGMCRPCATNRHEARKARKALHKGMTCLTAVGEALYGPSWQTPLSEALGVSDRTIRRWVAGNPIPEGAWDDIARLCKRRGSDLIGWSDHIQKR